MKRALIYTVKVWLTGVFLSPLLSNIIFFLVTDYYDNIMESLSLFAFEVIMGCIFSLFGLPLFFLLAFILIRQSVHNIKSRLILSVMGLLSTLGPTLFLTQGRFNYTNAIILYLPYTVVVLVSIWLYIFNPNATFPINSNRSSNYFVNP